MSDLVLNKEDCFNALPPEWPEDLLPSICRQLEKARTKVVILDDDPTGTQTVHGLPVLTTWDIAGLKEELKSREPAFFILTNSRGLTKQDACQLAREIGSNLRQASEQAGIHLTLISRSDSTLRGHFPHEVDEMAAVLGLSDLPYLICPFFLEGGRFTINDVHYVAEEQGLVPAALTSYAGDAAFGFSHSHLGRWVEEKTGGRIAEEKVVSISLDDIRKGGPGRVTEILLTVPRKGACFVNAASYRDIEVFVAGLLAAQEKGKQFLYRTAASFVRVRTGTAPKQAFLSREELAFDTPAGGLFVVGSYVPKTTAQVKALMDQTGILPVEISVEKVLKTDTGETEIEAAVTKVNTALREGKDTLVYTSRDLVAGKDSKSSLEIGQAVSAGLIKIIRTLDCRPRYLVAKGGITSSDVATRGLGVKRAMVLGQALPGVPVWKLGKESLYPGMSFIIFPGNVGSDQALALIQKKLSV